MTSVQPADPTAVPDPADLDVAGRVVVPGLVDAHVHLDKAYTLAALEERGLPGDGIAAAIEATRALRAELGPALVRPGMERLLTELARDGTVAARAHVELDRGTDPAVVGLHREVLAEHPGVGLQLVAFPQNGTSHDPDARRWMTRALDDGCEVVGGCPYADADPRAHLDLVLGLAADRGLPVDLHLDLTDDVADAQIDLVLTLVERAGLQGRTTVGHLTALSGFDPQRRRRTIDRLRELAVSVVVLPTTDLWLSGRTSARPGVRGLAPVRELLDGGVPVALASNNHQNAFTPVSGGGLLRVAWLSSLACHIGDAAGQARLLDAVTAAPAAMLGLGRWDVAPGSSVPLLLVDATDPLDLVRQAPAVLGRLC
ncbi:amidohydrolase family protein [Modestobacter versicolor]|uniref:amidohydrolase family protein n=1 Tax=Modestobacter versicolor TaxID=429133 RepID=UPI0034DE2148